ncbi:MFS transporter [Streptomyces sp. NPDC097619]|uniref:MFS transporter n=1 Tax=Streptomyces sp. NPDC097619 TaxID=3157228 RepID=UPI0033235BE6
MPRNPRAAWRSSPYRPVLDNAVLRRVLPGFAFSSLGDGMAVVAVGWLAIELAPPADRGLWVALAAAAYTVSGAVGGFLLGRFLRHVPPARLVAWDALLRATALGTIPVLHATGLLGVEGYVALLAVSSLLHSWGQAGIQTLIARVLPRRDHLAGNAVLAAAGSPATVLGPALATLLIAFGGPATVLAVDAATFLVLAATFLTAVPAGTATPGEARGAPGAEQAGDRPAGCSGGRSTGLAVIRSTPALSGLLLLSSAFFLLFGPVYVALPVQAAQGPGVGLLAAYYTAFGIGAVLGSVLTGLLRRLSPWPVTIGLVIGFGLLMLPVGLGTPAAVSVLCFGAAGLLWPPYSALSTTLFQRSAPDAQLPQVLAAASAVRVLTVPLGTTLGGPLVAGVGATGALLLSAAGIVGVGLVVAFVKALGAARARAPEGHGGEGGGARRPVRRGPVRGSTRVESAFRSEDG